MVSPLLGPLHLVQVDADIQIKFSHPEGGGSMFYGNVRRTQLCDMVLTP
jgi:hypothetical protein